MTVSNGSLLDDSDDESGGNKDLHANGEDDTVQMRMGLKMSAPVMVPDTVSPTTSVPSPGGQAKRLQDADEDDWNW